MSKYWFKGKRYGWGWYPATVQGWIVLAIYIALVTYRAIVVSSEPGMQIFSARPFILEVLLYTFILLIICYLKGEKPKWRWGDK